jgi:hypothetical protein
VGAQSLLWFGIGGGALVFAISLLRRRYIEKDRYAVSSRGGFTMFAVLMLIFAFGAIAAGIASAAAGR